MASPCHQHGAFDGVIQLTHVPRPRVIQQHLHGGLIEAGEPLAYCACCRRKCRASSRPSSRRRGRRRRNLDRVERRAGPAGSAPLRPPCGGLRWRTGSARCAVCGGAHPLEVARLEHRSSFACRFSEMFAMSRNSAAIASRTARRDRTSVNAPFTCPNSSLSKTPSEAAGVHGHEACPHASRSRIACATVPLPVPFSPEQHVASEGPARNQLQHRPWPPTRQSAWDDRTPGHEAACSPLRAAGCAARRGQAPPGGRRREASLSQGFCTSRAAAHGFDGHVHRPQAVITMTGLGRWPAAG